MRIGRRALALPQLARLCAIGLSVGTLAALVAGGRLEPEFPVAARCGTLVARLVGQPAGQRVVAKTGSLTGVVALSGAVSPAPLPPQPCPPAGATSGRVTYGGGRYLFDTAKDTDGLVLEITPGSSDVVIDFNYAYNASCAYSPLWACPLAPPENFLTVPVRAGELSYKS